MAQAMTEGVYTAEFLYIFRRGIVGAAACPARYLALPEQHASTQKPAGTEQRLPLEGKLAARKG